MNKRLLGGIIATVSFIITLTGCNTDLENSSAFESEEFVSFGEYSETSSEQDPIADSEIAVPEQQDSMTNPEISAPEQPDPNSDPAIDTPEYNNTLNIGEIEVAEDVFYYLYNMMPLFEMSRDKVLEHFGLNIDFELSGIVPGLYEVPPKNGLLNIDGKHGLQRSIRVENGVEFWEEVTPRGDNDQFDFESADGLQTATVFFQRKYSDETFVDQLRNKIYIPMDDGSFSSEPFHELPLSIIAGVEMRVAKRSIGGYYAEFSTDDLCVGLDTNGISEEKTVAILEYLAEYVGVANLSENNDIHAEEYNASYPNLTPCESVL